LKIAIYSGVIPSTTFIERLILGLAKEPNMELLIVGIKEKKTTYPRNVKMVSYETFFEFLFLFIKYFLLLAFTQPKALKWCFKNDKSGIYNHIKDFVKKAPILYHRPDIFHIQWAKSLAEWIFLTEQFGIKIVLSLRGAHITYSPIADAQLKKMYQQNFATVDAFHAVSKAIAKEAQQYGASPQKEQVVYSGLNLEQLTYSAKNKQGKKWTIVSVGRPHWIKGYHYALDAMAQLLKENPILPLRYKIIGGSTEELIYHINDLKLNNHVEVIPSLPFEQVKQEIKDANLLLMPSVQEGIANVVLEAMALGTLVISSNCEGMEEVIEHRVNGFLFSNRNVDDLVNVWKETMTLTEIEYQNITLQARRKIEQQHDEYQMIAGMVSLYNHCLH
jgi:colanic acid/amylovoran biosynthesis glycosyltransferase